MELALLAQVIWFTMVKDVLVQMDSLKLESDANNHVKTINWLMKMDCATNVHSMKSSLKENVFAETTTLETTPLEAVFLLAQLVNSNTKADALNAH